MKYISTLLVLFAVVLTSFSSFAQFPEQSIVTAQPYWSLSKVQPGGEIKLGMRVVITGDYHIHSNKPYDEFLIPTLLTLDSVPGITTVSYFYPKAHDYNFAFSDQPVAVFSDTIVIAALVKVDDSVQPGEYKIPVLLEFQACDDKVCLAPEEIRDTITIIVGARSEQVQPINEDIFLNVDIKYSSVALPTAEENSVEKTLADAGLLWGLFIVFWAGLLLNLTPCVYPLIPITISYFGGQAEGKTSRLAMMGLLYVLGIALTYSIVGVITALSGAVFGALLQSPVVIVIIAVIFVALALSMLGVYEFQLPLGLVNKVSDAKSGYFGAFFMGLTMGIVAAPCIGPFVLGLVTFVAAQGDVISGFLLFFFLAIGLGTPYFVLAIFSGRIKSLPRSGAWMDAVKHIFGIILLAMALYFLLPLIPKGISEYVLPVFALVAGLYLLFFEKAGDNLPGFKKVKLVLGVLTIAGAVYLLVPQEKQSIAWQPYSTEAVESAMSEGKPVIIDFYADWCIPCKELDALTFSDGAVIDESKRFVAFKADMTGALSEDLKKAREAYSVKGFPTVLVIDAKGNELARITGYVDAEYFINKLKKVSN